MILSNNEINRDFAPKNLRAKCSYIDYSLLSLSRYSVLAMSQTLIHQLTHTYQRNYLFAIPTYEDTVRFARSLDTWKYEFSYANIQPLIPHPSTTGASYLGEKLNFERLSERDVGQTDSVSFS